ncbi:hypothetical protein H5410_012317 [Solanum commersonii]|uniref:Uncharacterized protein n=1 Tax=Solanum commersonii TaxID=4109 RepID=A0A9J6AS25_SOLCO|nr:hypothetical protein H5410_012317 [Solanum commersonii]
MQLVMLGKNKIRFINSAVKRDQFPGNLSQLWDRCNAIVISWILCNISKDLHSSVLFCSDAYLIWEDLKERMLPESFSPTAMFTARPGIQKPKKAYNLNAFCDFCHMKGHLKVDYLKLLKCDFCHKTGHLKVNCYRLIGYPPHYKGKRGGVVAGNSTYDAGLHQQLLKMLDHITIHDSHGTANMAGSLDIAGHVHLPTGDSVKVTHIGDCHIGGGDVLRKVLCVPDFQFNLLSVSQDLLSGKVRVTSKEENGLYTICSQTQEEDKIPQRCLAVAHTVDPAIWHKRN